MGETNPIRLIDIAKKVGVSQVTAGAVLLGSGKGSVRVSKKTSDKIRRVARQMNYQPNIAARQLKGKRSKLIGVIIDSYAPQISFDRLSSMERAANRRGYRFMIGQSHGEIERIREYASDFLARGVDGVICVSHNYPDSGADIAKIYSQFKNVVFIEKPAITSKSVCYVEVDIVDGIGQAFSRLLSTNKLPVGLLLADLSFNKSKERKEGFIQAHKKAGIEYNDNLIYVIGELGDDIVSERFDDAVEHWMFKHKLKSIIALNDIFAIHIINALMRKGLSVPNDVAVIGCDNIKFASMFNPALTTIDQKQDKLSSIAVDMLVDMIEDDNDKDNGRGKYKNRQIVIKPELIIRQSA